MSYFAMGGFAAPPSFLVSSTKVGIYIYICIYIWVNYNDLTATSLVIIVSKGNHPQMDLIQVSEIL